MADNNRAISDFDKVLELDPDNTIAYLNRSMLKNEIGDKGGALSDLNMVLEAHPDFFNGYYMRSQLKRELNDLRGSENDYLLARAEEAKARKNATSNIEPLDKMSGDDGVKATRDETDTNIEKFNLLVVAHEEDSQKSKYQRQSRGKVQNIHARWKWNHSLC